MNKISLYILLILIFLGFSKSFSPNLKNINFIKDERMFSKFIKDGPLSLILIESYEQGTFIKSYFQKYRVVHGFKPLNNQFIIFRTSKKFWEKGKTVLQKQSEKKYGKGATALDIVKKKITAKHGKGAIMDTKKK